MCFSGWRWGSSSCSSDSGTAESTQHHGLVWQPLPNGTILQSSWWILSKVCTCTDISMLVFSIYHQRTFTYQQMPNMTHLQRFMRYSFSFFFFFFFFLGVVVYIKQLWFSLDWLLASIDYFHCSVENRFITGGNYRVLSSSRRRLRPSSKLENRPRKLKVQTTQETLCSLKRFYMCVIAGVCLSEERKRVKVSYQESLKKVHTVRQQVMVRKLRLADLTSGFLLVLH